MKRWLPITALFLFAICTSAASAQTFPRGQWSPNPNWTPRPHASFAPGSFQTGQNDRFDRHDNNGRWDGDRREREERERRDRERWERDHHHRGWNR